MVNTGDLIWVIKDRNGDPAYEIRPYSNKLCYEIWEWADIKNRDTGEVYQAWRSMGYYPSDLDHACCVLRDKLLINTDLKSSDLSSIRRAITNSTNLIVESVKEALGNDVSESG